MDYEYWQAKHLWFQKKYKLAYRQFIKYCKQECKVHWENLNWRREYRFYRTIYVIMVMRDLGSNLVYAFGDSLVKFLFKFKYKTAVDQTATETND